LARTWQAITFREPTDATLIADLRAALATAPDPSTLHHALGLALAVAPSDTPAAQRAAAASEHFTHVLADRPRHVLAGLNRAEALSVAGRTAEAIEQARRALALLDDPARLDPALLDSGHHAPTRDVFGVQWEFAAWQHAGDPADEHQAKYTLLRWRLYGLLARLTGELPHRYEAALARSDLPATRAALGSALFYAGRPADAIWHLRQALDANPLDKAAARLLFEALAACGRRDGQEQLARERRRLHQEVPHQVPAEAWFLETPPLGDELASLIILCHNEVEYTRQCLDSVLAHTRPPYELILLDNASTDETPAYLEEVRAHFGPARVEVLRNATNVGFPAGCNQGLRAAQGRYLVFLNNDTIVTPGWLDGLIAWSLRDWPNVGLVGAVTNYSWPPQQVAVDYQKLDDLNDFAAQRRHQYAGQALETQRLAGFCLLVRQEVLRQIGGFDERFGLGFFDDDDLSVRARRAGFRLLVAQDVFIHHFGSRTFTSLGIDIRSQLRQNFTQFHAKWGHRETAGYRLPDDSHATPAAAEGRESMPLALLYETACATPSDINEHLPVLHALARECRDITEMGTRTGVSTTAFLYARPAKLVCYDCVKYPEVNRLAALAAPTEFVFYQQDVLTVEIEPTDLLFLDTWHVYEQLREELRRHAGKVRRYIVLHDTTTFGEYGEKAGHRGLWPAVEEFLAQGRFRLKDRYENNNGLTVLEALPGDNGR
jgi:GT2 family glycosyltransferase